MNNFDHAISANEDAMNAAGSASRENERAMESLELKVNLLKATFEDLSNNVLESDTVKALIDVANGFLSLLNTGIGPSIVQFSLLTAGLTGFLSILGQTGGHLLAMASNFKKGTGAANGFFESIELISKGGKKAEAGIKGLTSASLAFGATISAVIVGIQLLVHIFDAITVSTEEAKEALAQAKTELQELDDEYKTLNEKAASGELTKAEEERLRILEQQLEVKRQIYAQDTQDLYEQEWTPETYVVQGETVAEDKATPILNDLQSSIRAYQGIKEAQEGLGEITEDNIDKYEQFDELLKEHKEDILKNVDAFGVLYDELVDYQEQGVSLNELSKERLKQYPELLDFLEEEGIITGDLTDKLKEAAEKTIDFYDGSNMLEKRMQAAAEYSGNLSSQLEKLQGDYQALNDFVAEYNSTGRINAELLGVLFERDIDLYDALELQNGQLVINNDWIIARGENLKNIAKRELTAQTATQMYDIAVKDLTGSMETMGTTASNEEENLSGLEWVLSQVAAGAIEAGVAFRYLMASMDPSDTKGRDLSQEAKEEIRNIMSEYEDMMHGLDNDFDWNVGGNISASSSSGPSSKATGPLEAQKDLYEEQNELIEWKIELMEKEGASAEELAQAWKDYQTTLKEQEQWYRDQGLDETSEYVRDTIDAWHDAQDEIENIGKDSLDELISQTEDYISDRKDLTEMGAAEEYQIWAKLLEQIDKLNEQGLVSYEYYIEQRQEILHEMLVLQKEAAEEAEEAAEEAREAYIEQLEQQQDVYEKFFSYMTDRIQDEIDALEEQRDREEEYWDAKIDALQEQNDEIERQIQLEQLQAALAASRQSRVMVYKDGRFQYIQDIDEISEAQANLESYQREEALRQEVENLEKLKEQALETLDQQIEAWEDYKEQWSSVVEHYQEEQDRLLIEEKLGIKLEGDLWKERLDNLSSYVSQYEALMSRLAMAANMEISVGGGGSSSGGNRYPVGGGAHGGVTNNDGTWSPFPGGPVYSGGVAVGGTLNKGTTTGSKTTAGSSPSRSDPAYDHYYYLKDNGAPSWVIRGEQYRVESGIKDKYTRGPGSYMTSQGYNNTSVTKNARGTINSPAGISLVGEEGPELRVLNQGDGIIPAEVTKNLWSWGEMSPYDFMNKIVAYQSMGGKTITNTIENLNISLPNVKNGEEFARYCKENLWRTAVQREAV